MSNLWLFTSHFNSGKLWVYVDRLVTLGVFNSFIMAQHSIAGIGKKMKLKLEEWRIPMEFKDISDSEIKCNILN